MDALIGLLLLFIVGLFIANKFNRHKYLQEQRHSSEVLSNSYFLDKKIEELTQDNNNQAIISYLVLLELNQQLQPLREENENLKRSLLVLDNEKEKLTQSNTTQSTALAKLNQQLQPLREENKKLTKINDTRSGIFTTFIQQFQSLREENKKLKRLLIDGYKGGQFLLGILDKIKEANDRDFYQNVALRAPTAAERIKELTQRKRAAELERDEALCLVEYYRELLPDADDIKESLEELEDPIESPATDPNEDVAIRYLSKDEYRTLSESERNQRALDAFWNRNKSKRLIGKLYEQYVGYLFEKDGYSVEYYGVHQGLHDLGRDLICEGKGSIKFVQCKNWSKSKTIYEKHIFQLFGTVYQYKRNHPSKNVTGVFYTSTHLSDLARDFAQEFGIEVFEDFPLKPFPIIKCHVSKTGELIYHLPFDQQYDVTKIEPQHGDFYCMTVSEAESRGFRRAWRWRGQRE